MREGNRIANYAAEEEEGERGFRFGDVARAPSLATAGLNFAQVMD